MFSWLHEVYPKPMLLEFGGVKIHWYGLIIVLAIVISIFLILRLTKSSTSYMERDEIEDQHSWNLFFYLIIFGIIGARLYHVLFYNFDHFINQPLGFFKIWQGGLAIHGAIIAGIIVIYFYCKKHQINFLRYLDIFALVMPLGQAIGRWGNYFNQELFGKPCDFNWCIPIQHQFGYFHPVFLYESLLNLILFVILLILYKSSTIFFGSKKIELNKTKKLSFGLITLFYLIGYSVIRFFMEFLRLDVSQIIFGLNWVQWLCLFVIIISVFCHLFTCVTRSK